MNQVNFVGRIVREIEVRDFNHGSNKVVNNVIAINRRKKDKDGNYPADFIPFVAWDHYATLLEKYCQKGSQIAISGRMQSRSYNNSQGQTVYVVECVVNDITLVGGRPNSNYQSSDDSKPASQIAEDVTVPNEPLE